MKATKKKRAKDMNELTKGYEEFIKGKEQREDGKKNFERTIKKEIKKGATNSRPQSLQSDYRLTVSFTVVAG